MKKLTLLFVILCAITAFSIGTVRSRTIYIVGDSTVASYKSSAYPQTGWGQVLSNFFDASKVDIYNAAIGGRSSKTFIEEGRLDALDGLVKEGDFLFIQFGHNDRYFGQKAREVPFDSLDFWLESYLEKAKSWGAVPVLISPMMMNTYPRNVFSTDLSTKSEYDVRKLMETLARRHRIPFVDLNFKSYRFHQDQLADYISRYFFKYFLPGEYPNYPAGVVNDGVTHFQESGSLAHAQWILEELSENAKADYLSADVKSQLLDLLSAAKPRYAVTARANTSLEGGLISHVQNLPGGAPLTLHVSPSSFGRKFLHWVDDDCNVVSNDSNFYGSPSLYRNATYTAIFDGGEACSPIAHDAEELPLLKSSSSASLPQSSSSVNDACAALEATLDWKSPVDAAFPDRGIGTTDANHENFTGQGFFNVENSDSSDFLLKLVSEQSASNAKLMIRYANGGFAARPMKITVDAGTYEAEFPPTGSWDVWDSVVIENVWVDALPFDFRMKSVTSEGGPNIDLVAFDISSVYREGCSAAEIPLPIVKKNARKERAARENGRACVYDVSGTCHSACRKENFSKGVYF